MFVLDMSDINHATDPSHQVQLNRLAAVLIDLIECGLIACDPDGKLLHANRSARRELAHGESLQLAEGSIRCANGSQSDLLGAFRDAAFKQKSRLISIGDDSHRLVVVTMPIPFGASETPAVLLMIGQRTLCSPLALEMLANRHHLTYAEHRVFRALLANQCPREIAASHSVSLPTVRTQIQSIREKVGVRSIDQLLLFAAQIPPVSARYDIHAT